jgi:hypothetical protein
MSLMMSLGKRKKTSFLVVLSDNNESIVDYIYGPEFSDLDDNECIRNVFFADDKWEILNGQHISKIEDFYTLFTGDIEMFSRFSDPFDNIQKKRNKNRKNSRKKNGCLSLDI